MKKILAITVAVMYLAITSGLVLQIHYCMGRQTGSSVQFAELKHSACGSCGMESAKNKCCHDDVKFVKLQDVHQQVNADYNMVAPATNLSPVENMPCMVPMSVDTSGSTNSSPPDDDDGQPSLFIFQHLLRI